MKEKQSHSDHSQEKLNDLFQLILYNDDHNSFEHVIRAMVEVCGHDPVQAEQCAVIAHFTGRCDIRRGDRSVLDRMGSDLRARGLKVEIIK
jgi:ATP-dependent Clp protease adaptor protein ClpS